MVKVFSTERLNAIFADKNYEDLKNLMFDLAQGNEIFDGERVISKAEANEKVREICFAVLGIEKGTTGKAYKRAMKAHGTELFEILEEVIDLQVSTGWKETEFFNSFVDEKSQANGDSNEFYVEKPMILSVAKIAGNHHDLTVQTLNAGETTSIPMSTYAVKVGKDIELFLTGREDFARFTTAVANAFINKAQNEMYSEVMNASAKLPHQATLVKTGTLGSTTKADFDELIDTVSGVNDGAPVVIMGVRAALKKINDLADVQWISDAQKADVANMGRLGMYEGNLLIEVPQRFAPNDITTPLVNPKKLLIMPQVDNKFVKAFMGETEIVEVNEKGANMDDAHTYEVQRQMGIGTIISRYFGCWNLQ